MNKSILGLALLSVGFALPLRSDIRAAQGRLSGVALPSRVIHLGASADGLISEVRVERGDRVEAGQVLVTLEFGVQAASNRLAQARRDSSASLESARTRAQQAKARLVQREKLVAEGLVTEEETSVYRTNARLAELDEQMAKEAKRIAGLEFERSSALLEQGSIESPISGIVADRFLSPGEMLTKSGSGEVLTLVQLDPLLIETHAPLELFESIHPGQSAEIRFIGIDLGVQTATVTVVDQMVDTASDTFRVRLELPNADFSIPAGLRVEIELVP